MYNVLEYLENSSKSTPNKIAFADIEKEISYSHLVRKAKAIGSVLCKKTNTRRPIPVFMDKGIDAITAFFGIVYAGCFYVMMDTKQPKIRLDHIMQTLNSDFILSSRKYQREIENLEYQNKVIYIDDMLSDNLVEIQIDQLIDEEALCEIRKNHIDIDPLYSIFTSGSTGVPKGVVVSHRSTIDFIDEFTATFDINVDDVVGNQAPWDFDVSVKDIYSTIAVGARMEIIPKQHFSMPVKLLDFLIERKVTTIIWAVSAVCIISTLKGFDYKVPKDIRKVMFSGEVMPIKHLNIWKQYLPKAKFVNLYGPTEITCNCTYHVIDKEYEVGDKIPIGKTFKNERVFLLDDENQLIEPNQSSALGEICISGTAVTLGYYNNWEQTNKAFVQNPLNSNYIEIIYRTGDLGYYNGEGELCFSSRKDFQIKHMGHRIELGEIEIAIEKVDEIIRVCCIFENNKINAFYEGDIEKKELHRKLKSTLPMFMLPNKYIQMGSLPLNKNGKIDRNKLKELLEV